MYLVVGAGLSGCVIARVLAQEGFMVDIYEERSHIAGNCYDFRDEETNIMVHAYGPHIFHTDNKEVWEFMNQFGEFTPFTTRTKAIAKNNVYSLPINLHTINQFFEKTFSPSQAFEFIQKNSVQTIKEPKNFEEQALKFIGKELYETFFKGYTKKQWGVDPTLLPASILKRLPVRFNYDDNYFNHKYQGIPVDGYCAIVEKMINHKNINVYLNKKFTKEQIQTDKTHKNIDNKSYKHIFYTGAIDQYFEYIYGRLPYRTLKFETIRADGDYQGNAVINYCDEDIPYTRITEHKHFLPHEKHEKTICFKEYPMGCEDGDIPFYPINFSQQTEQLEQYLNLSKNQQDITFLGRLGTFRYLDMDVAIKEALEAATIFLRQIGQKGNL